MCDPVDLGGILHQYASGPAQKQVLSDMLDILSSDLLPHAKKIDIVLANYSLFSQILSNDSVGSSKLLRFVLLNNTKLTGLENLELCIDAMSKHRYIQSMLAPEIFKAIRALPRNEQVQLIKKLSQFKVKEVGLLHVFQAHPDLIDVYLEAARDDACKNILSEVNERGDYPLMVAIKDHPVALKSILFGIKQLDTKVQCKLLCVLNFNKHNALMCAAFFRPEVVDPILERVKDLEANDQHKIYKQSRCMLGITQAFRNKLDEAALRLYLDQFKVEVDRIKTLLVSDSFRYIEVSYAADLLYDQLNSTYEQYLRSSKDQGQRAFLISTWKQAIQYTRKEILVEFPTIKDILEGLLLLLASIIVPPYGIYRVATQYNQHRSAFFTTNTERSLNALEDNIGDLSKVLRAS